MADTRDQMHAAMRKMVEKYFADHGDAARQIEDYWSAEPVCADRVDYSGFSRKMNRSRAWSLNDAYALYRITGDRSLAALFKADDADDARPVRFSHMRTLKEGHEAVMSQAKAEGSDDPEVLIEALIETNELGAVAVEDAAYLRHRLRELGVSREALAKRGAA